MDEETQPRTLDESKHPDERVARKGFQVISLGVLAIALAVAFYSANSVVAIWFEHRWVPVARLVFALIVAAVAIGVILRLTRKNA